MIQITAMNPAMMNSALRASASTVAGLAVPMVQVERGFVVPAIAEKYPLCQPLATGRSRRSRPRPPAEPAAALVAGRRAVFPTSDAAAAKERRRSEEGRQRV